MAYPPGLYEATHQTAAVQAVTIGMAGFFDQGLTHLRARAPGYSKPKEAPLRRYQ